MPSSEFELIRQAILDGKNIEADYDGYHRIMTPHAIGTKDHAEKCLCYQFGGESSQGNVFPQNSPDNWRCVHVSRLRNIAIVEGDLHTCNIHTRKQTCIDRVVAEAKVTP